MSTATQRKTHCLFLSWTKAFLFELPQPPKQNKTKRDFRLEDVVIWEAESLWNSHITSFRYFLLYLTKKKKQAWMDIPFGLRVTSHISPHIYNPKLHAGLVRRPTPLLKAHGLTIHTQWADLIHSGLNENPVCFSSGKARWETEWWREKNVHAVA